MRHKLVRVEDEGREEPRNRCQANGAPDPTAAQCRRAAGHEHKSAANQQTGAIVEADCSVVQVEASNLLEAKAGRGRLANEGAALGRQPSARVDVGGPTRAELLHHIVSDDLRLEDEEERGQGAELHKDALYSHLQALLATDLNEKRQGVRNEKDDHEPREGHRQCSGHNSACKNFAFAAVLERVEGAALTVRQENQQPHEDE
mmetsp:Transcript_127729/g.272390  ORF Transcript_127729/g.272390 Transcript_127729/m.272390 type:complete len:203 (-) Transcript_127729:203-811(-)